MLLAKLKEGFTALSPRHCLELDYRARGCHLDIAVAPEQVVQAAEIMAGLSYTLEAITGVDWLVAAAPKKPAPAKTAEGGGEPAPEETPVDQLEVVYDYTHTGSELCRVVVRCRMPREAARLPTISRVYPGANWHERETHDFFGIVFEGHPDLSPLLLPEDADFHPLLKDFQA